MIPTCNDTWAPWMIRANTSRPSSSVPIGCAQLGAWSLIATSSSGSIVQMYGPKSAIRMLSPTMIAPAMPIGLRHFANRPARRAGVYTHASSPTSLGRRSAPMTGISLFGMLLIPG